MTMRQIDFTIKPLHLWEDKTWDTNGGHFVGVPEWHWEMINRLIDQEGLRRELSKRMLKAVKNR